MLDIIVVDRRTGDIVSANEWELYDSKLISKIDRKELDPDTYTMHQCVGTDMTRNKIYDNFTVFSFEYRKSQSRSFCTFPDEICLGYFSYGKNMFKYNIFPLDSKNKQHKQVLYNDMLSISNMIVIGNIFNFNV